MSELAATNELAPAAPARTPTGTAPAGLRGVAQTVQGFIAQPAVAKTLPLLGFVALLGLAAMIWMVFSAAPSRTLFSGLADEEKAAVVEALRTANVPYTIDSTTGSILVSTDQYHEAKMMLASQGLPRSGPDGSEVISNLPLGASRAVETEQIRSARELDLARTIEGIDVVQSARVHLAVETPSVFVRERAQPAASVMVTLAPGRTLGESQVQAIVHLVASSVPGLAPEGVSVVDQNGRLLSNSGGNGVAAESERQLAVQTAVEDRYRQAITALLTPMLGAGNFTAEVHAEMDFSEVQSTREGFPANERALRSEEGQLSTEAAGTPGEAAGIPGALSNQAPPPAEVATTPEGTPPGDVAAAGGETVTPVQRTENYSRNFAVGREVSVTRQQTGTVKRVTVAVALRNPEGAQPRGRQEIQSLEQLIKGAVGFDQARGDVVTLTARAFAPTEETAPSWWEAGWVSLLARNLTALALAALLVFGLAKPLLRKGSTMLANRSTATRAQVSDEIASVLADRSRKDADLKVSLEMIEATRDYETRASLIRSFVRQDPARAALVVRDLIRSDTKNGVERNG